MSENTYKSVPEGAFCSQEQLIHMRFQAQNLKLLQRKKALSLLTGPNKTSFRGRGIDFDEVRRYQPGDDIRTIDWRVTARSGKAHTKLFREERERPLLIVTDQRTSMFFGRRSCFKSVTAAHIAALLAWSGLQNGDRVGGLVFNEQGHTEIRPRRSRQAVLAQLHHIAGYNQDLPLNSVVDGSRFEFVDLMSDLRHIAKPGTAIFIISDFSGAEEKRVYEHLYQLSQHAEVTAIHVSDPLEAELPPSGNYIVTNGQLRSGLFTGDKQLRGHYHADYQQRIQSIQSGFSRVGVPFIDITTEQSPLAVLQTFYGKAERQVRRQ